MRRKSFSGSFIRAPGASFRHMDCRRASLTLILGAGSDWTGFFVLERSLCKCACRRMDLWEVGRLLHANGQPILGSRRRITPTQ